MLCVTSLPKPKQLMNAANSTSLHNMGHKMGLPACKLRSGVIALLSAPCRALGLPARGLTHALPHLPTREAALHISSASASEAMRCASGEEARRATCSCAMASGAPRLHRSSPSTSTNSKSSSPGLPRGVAGAEWHKPIEVAFGDAAPSALGICLGAALRGDAANGDATARQGDAGPVRCIAADVKVANAVSPPAALNAQPSPSAFLYPASCFGESIHIVDA
mmetsp:Transcript_130366/g.377149  ORF Transcript_130366/g.377149 Transcript_130366/m.377149 type:complete len:222 (-) Transcript_130366:1668-2333(-)